MSGSDRLEENADQEVSASSQNTNPVAEVTGSKAVPKRRSRAKSPSDQTSDASSGNADVATEIVASQPAPKRRSRAKQAADHEKSVTPAKAKPVSSRSSSRARTKKTQEPQEVSSGPISRTPRLLERYRASVKDTLRQEFGYANVMQVPRLQKVVLNIGLGETKTNPRAMESAVRDLSLITAQKPVTTRAKRSIAGFKLREGEPIGTSVTLRGNRMYEFMDRLLNAALPRIRDFRGVSGTAFDGNGNYTLGIREQVIFPEIDYGQIDRVRSLQVSIVTTADDDNQAMRLLDLLGMPFARENRTR